MIAHGAAVLDHRWAELAIRRGCDRKAKGACLDKSHDLPISDGLVFAQAMLTEQAHFWAENGRVFHLFCRGDAFRLRRLAWVCRYGQGQRACPVLQRDMTDIVLSHPANQFGKVGQKVFKKSHGADFRMRASR